MNTMSEHYKIGEQVGISLKALFEANTKEQSLAQTTTCSLTYGHIRRSGVLGDEYYDYYDRMEDFMLCDGEVVTVKEITDTDVIFETDENFEFRLARDEAGIAIFKDAPEHNIEKNNIER